MNTLATIVSAVVLVLVQSDVIVLGQGGAGVGNPNCARTCAGTTGRETTNWTDYSGGTGIYYDVDISACGFLYTPIITTAIEGTSTHWEITGTSAVYNSSPATFRIYIGANRPNTRKALAEKYKWNIQWIAVGYQC